MDAGLRSPLRHSSPYISDKESYFCSILVYSTYVSHSSILTHFLFWGKQGGRGCLFSSQQFLHAVFVLGAARLFKKCIQSKSEQFFKSFFHPQLLHLLLLMSPATKRHVIPCVHSLTKQQQKWERSQRHKLSPLLCPNSVHSWFSFHILHNHSSVL